MKMRFFLPFIVAFLSALSLNAQDVLKIGDWKAHLPFNTFNKITQSADKVFAGTDYGVLTVDKADFSIEKLSKVDGLTDSNVRLLEFHNGTGKLLVAYNSGVIDIVDDNEVRTLYDIANFQGLLGGKTILAIYEEDADHVLICGNFGIARFNITEEKFVFSTFTGVDVEAVTVHNGRYYIATEDGVFSIATTNGALIDDFREWEFLEVGTAYFAQAVLSHQGALYYDVNGALNRMDADGTMRMIYEEAGYQLSYLTNESDHLLAGFVCVDNCDSRLMKVDIVNATVEEIGDACVSRTEDAVEDDRGRIWLADGFRNLRYLESDQETCNQLTFNNPYSESSFDMVVVNDTLLIASGGYAPNFSYLFRPDGFAQYDGDEWSIYNRFSLPELGGLSDFIAVAAHPTNGKKYGGSFLDGLVELNGDSVIIYNDTTSTLNNPLLDDSRTRVSGLAFDDNNNLWVANHSAERPVSILQENGEWVLLNLPGVPKELLDVAIDQAGFAWFAIGAGGEGVVVIDAGELNVAADDRYRVFTSGNSELPSNNVNCVTTDLDGDIWVGTDEGAVVFECGNGAFESFCLGNHPVVEQDSFGALLLETQNVRAIAVDGANRKWFGTESGIFVQSANGRDQIAFYDKDNSPLFDNVIYTLAINQNTGVVYIGTERGIQSLKIDAVEGGISHKANLEVFPNPVRPEYEGPIAIKGLARDATVKITDAAGRLVFETTALGGQAIWDGTDYTGRRVSTGVYLVLSSSTRNLNTPNTGVGKILFVN